MKHNELWNDTTNDLLPPGSLAMMQQEARRLRVRRRIARVSTLTSAIALCAWLVFNTDKAPPPAQTAQEAPEKPTVRYLDDAALVDRLRDAGIGIAIHNTGDQKQMLLVSTDGRIYSP